MKLILITFVLVYSSAIIFVKVPKMFKNKLYRESIVFIVLTFLGTLLGIMKILNFSIPNPNDLIRYIYAPISDALKAFTS